MAERKPQTGLLILAGIGAGVLVGAMIGLILVTRKRRTDPSTETVDVLRDKAERVLHELEGSISELKETTQRISADIASATESSVTGPRRDPAVDPRRN